MGTKYTKEFKTEAIRLSEREGVAAASEKLGIGANFTAFTSNLGVRLS